VPRPSAGQQRVELAGGVEFIQISEPPMWRSPMNICGTVCRPLRLIISTRRSGCSSRQFPQSPHPCRAAGCARTRSRDTRVGIHFNLGCGQFGKDLRATKTGSLVARNRQLLGPPGVQAAAQGDHLAKSLLRQLAMAAARAPRSQ
jgi:hypothetical protein